MPLIRSALSFPMRRLRRFKARRKRIAFENLVSNYFEAKYSADSVISRHDMSSVLPPHPDDYEYRLYVAEWAARRAARLSDGMFVAIGTATGKHVLRILERVHPSNPYWLIDTWDGRRSSSDATVDYPESVDFEAVQKTFAPHPNVHLLRGLVPGILEKLPIQKIAFSFFCLGDTQAEIESFRILLPRIDRGGIFVLNGFGRRRTSDAQRREFIDIAKTASIELFIMPSGHALVFG